MENNNDMYLNFLETNNFDALLKYANDTLTKDKSNEIALEYKSIALLYLGLYDESLTVPKTLLLPNNNLFEITRLSKACLTFDKSYEHYICIEFPSNWLEKRLIEQIEKVEEEFLNSFTSYSKDDFLPRQCGEYAEQTKARIYLHDYLSKQFHEVFILGAKNVVDKLESPYTCDDILASLKYPFSQAYRNAYVYTKEQNYKLPFNHTEEGEDHWHDDNNDDNPVKHQLYYTPLYNAPFPVIDWYLDLQNVIMQHPGANVYYSNCIVNPFLHKMVYLCLDKLANTNKDYIAPMYHNIIDPNLTAIKHNSEYQWTATDIIVEEQTISKFNTLMSLQLIMKRYKFKLSKYILVTVKNCLQDKKIPKGHIVSPISNIPMETNRELYVITEEILNVALPILGKMTKPALMLPGKIQAVIKAQLLYLKPGEEFQQGWRIEGVHENIVAVVIYYYKVSEQLIGGDLEFLDKQPINEHYNLYDDDGEYAYTKAMAKEDLDKVPYCRVPIKSGTLVVFSNYQMINRVLKMTCNPVDTDSEDGSASRDSLIFYIIDQSRPLSSTKVNLKVEETSIEGRTDMFNKQIEHSGLIVPDTELVNYSGTRIVQVGWINELDYDFGVDFDTNEANTLEGFQNIKLMNDTPPLNRGLSWAFDTS
jgi:hypothetical protein